MSCESGWQVQVSVYSFCRIPAQLGYTQCSILLHLMNICFLPCICLWQISQIQTCLSVVVGPGFVSTSPAFMRSSASHAAGPHGWLARHKGKSDPPLREVSTQFAACRLCRLEHHPVTVLVVTILN